MGEIIIDNYDVTKELRCPYDLFGRKCFKLIKKCMKQSYLIVDSLKDGTPNGKIRYWKCTDVSMMEQQGRVIDLLTSIASKVSGGK